ncbi:tetratricopeptide repeat protein [Syntrophorhabdus aromaticivorans]|jgi:tetratricopeptide (TPR) repeat protein|uniref:Tetratricopeptide repeat protein n=1 Tax=Syntrophorhabdus aromaticivorans TaxID=328301 RepID=A0A351U4S5_9BACT|nr:tetratricopeptide repeat protein [Syntrophorhabdus aromaticivorans]NLW35886.1 tetratricopeptide repeat protein [Syntrophorhabdus aromaticivorans]HBA54956.1 tetratricopeptide repeat protein [Syntrophorhabdus aromaticivorans]
MNKNAVLSATLAEIYLEQGYPEKAIETYTRLLEREPGNQTYKKRLASLKREIRGKNRLSPFRRALKHKLW